MSWGFVAVAGATIIGAVVNSESSKDAAKSQTEAARSGISSQNFALSEFNRRTEPFSDLGLSASDEIANLLGIQVANPEIKQLQSELGALEDRIAAGPPPPKKSKGSKSGGFLGGAIGGLAGLVTGDPITGNILGHAAGGQGTITQEPFDLAALTAQQGELQSRITELQELDAARPAPDGLQGIEEINPLVSFIRNEGFEDIQNSAAARGRLGAGGTLKDLTEFNTQVASTVVPQLQNQKFNQLFNLLGLGANAATGQGTAGLNTASNVSNLLGNIGNAQAQGAIGQGQAISGAVSGLAGAFGAQQGGAFTQTPPPPSNVVGGTQNINAFAGHV